VMKIRDIRLVVSEVRGTSSCGMKVGDAIEVRDSSRLSITRGEHFCMFALAAALPVVVGAERSIANDDWIFDGIEVCCPDPKEGLVMRLEFLEEREVDGRIWS